MQTSAPPPVVPSDDAPVRELGGFAGHLATALAVGLSLYALYWVIFIVQPQVYRVSFLLIALILSFLLYPFRRQRPGPEGSHRTVSIADWLLIFAAIAVLSWPIIDFNAFVYRATNPLPVDLVFGAITVLLVLEATRRSVGWILPVTAVAFLIYAYAGPSFDRLGLPMLAHRGYGLDRLIGTLYMTLEGMFGVPLDVAATYIVLFTIYGAVLELSGAGAFFINWAMATAGRSRSGAGPGRTVTLAGFLLGTVSGSGVATTVMLGSVSWPLLRKAGYKPEVGGAILSAAGIGALLSPPTLGAAAFLIAEFLRISYLQVLVMATIPTVLYYLSIFLMIEADSRRLETRPAAAEVPDAGVLTRRYWYHFTSLLAIAVLMITGMSAFRAVFWATVLAFALSFIRRESALTPPRLLAALRAGGTGVLGVAATTATAGIIVGVVTLTGLGLKVAGIIVALAGGTLFLTVRLLRNCRLAAWPCCSSDRLVHHCRRHGGAGAGAVRGAARRGAYVHLLLRRPLRSQPADRTLAVRRRGHHRRQPLQDDDADLEVHAAGVPRAVRVHVERGGPWCPSAGAARRRRDRISHGSHWRRRTCRGFRRLDERSGFPPDALPPDPRRPPSFLCGAVV